MKRLALAALLSGCSLAFAQTQAPAPVAPAAPPGATAVTPAAPPATPPSARVDFGTQKARQIAHVQRQIEQLNALHACLEAAQTPEALRECHPRRGPRGGQGPGPRHMPGGPMGGPMGGPAGGPPGAAPATPVAPATPLPAPAR